MDSTIVSVATKAAKAANFVSFQCNPTLEIGSTTVAPIPHKQVVLMVVTYIPNRLSAFDTALRTFCRTVEELNELHHKDVIILYSSYLSHNQYVIALSRVKYLLRITDSTALPSDTTLLQSGSDTLLAPQGKRRKTKVEISEVGAAMANVDDYLRTAEGHDKLRHDDEVYEDLELVVQNADSNELILYMESPSHQCTMHYIVTINEDLSVADMVETHDNECRACMLEYNERVALGRGGW